MILEDCLNFKLKFEERRFYITEPSIFLVKKIKIMHNYNKRRIRFAWLLMLVYLPIMLAITFHHHSKAEGADSSIYCYDCAHHIHHNGHLIAEQNFAHDCVLCRLCSLPYVVPTIVKLTIFIVSIHVAFRVACPFIKKRKGDVHSTRAPPCFNPSFYLK